MNSQPDTRHPTPAHRYRSVDLLRGFAVVVMVAGHACDALLADRFKDGALWNAVDIFFGFIAPLFLFYSGVMIGRARSTERVGRRVAARLGWLLFLAYWIQTPVLSFRQLVWNQRPEELSRMFDTNILHAIAYAGLLALLLLLTIPSSRPRAVVSLLFALGIVVATPYVQHARLDEGLWLPFRSFIAPQPIATFSLLPYAAYLLIGFAVAPVVLRVEEDRRRALAMLGIGTLMVIGGLLLDAMLQGSPIHGDFWRTSAQHVLFRLGGVVILGAIAAMIAPLLRAPSTIVEELGRRSLAIYLLHLILLYGSPLTMGARYWFDSAINRALSLLGTIAAAIVLLALCYGALRIWEELRVRSPLLARVLAIGFWGAFALLFLTIP